MKEALKLALEALERCGSENYTIEREAITAIKEALREHAMYEVQRLGQEIQPEPPQRTWVGLTDEEQKTIADLASANDWHDFDVIDTTEAKLKQKNGYDS